MRVLRSCLLLVVLVIPVGAHAGDHKADVFFAPSYLMATGSTNHLGGWHISAAAVLKEHKKVSFVGDLSTHFFTVPGTSDGGKDLTQITFMGGPRITWGGGGEFMPFLHVMALGAVYRSDGRLQVSNAAGAASIGAGFDLAPGTQPATPKSLALLKGPGMRFQADLIKPWATDPKSDLKWSLRVSFGFLYRFHDPH